MRQKPKWSLFVFFQTLSYLRWDPAFLVSSTSLYIQRIRGWENVPIACLKMWKHMADTLWLHTLCAKHVVFLYVKPWGNVSMSFILCLNTERKAKEKRQEEVFPIKQRGKFLSNWTNIRESFHHCKATQLFRFIQGLRLCNHHCIVTRFTIIQCQCLWNCIEFCWYLYWLSLDSKWSTYLTFLLTFDLEVLCLVS